MRALLLLLILATGPPRETWTVRVAKEARESVVVVKAQKKSGRKDTIGAGFITERGIVTARHVVAGAVAIRVELADGTSFVGELAFEDPAHDLALVRIQTERKLRPLVLAGEALAGEDVIAIGHPFGYLHTVSKGIISGTGRSIEMPGGVVLKGLLQTTASINPGNSGIPILNADGEVLGIAVAYRDEARGIAFAVPSVQIKAFLGKK